ncbi:peptidoglycan recognition protein family protein [Natronoglycomyces albus]|uniref:N-acetylmuramoyl-L-alanine amidase n=1 Tax=Natronoglycomyces albus TaxID=2811108 RepID=A0A895XG98_9ACTN|nr:peptidoglycan recognition family protein [Natronoglycomyces albus]QSB04364.1 N-acetylmuramoyl-L-alanine amidase [Natronoglycomyces albus]
MSNSKFNRRALLAGTASVAGLAALPALPANADVSQQAVFNSVAHWGARSPNGTPRVIWSRPNKIIIHHTVYPNTTDYSVAQAYRHARQVQNLHMNSNGWIDTGYNFIVSRGGHCTEGRTGSLPRMEAGSAFIQGAHTAGQNAQSIGIAAEGSYHTGAAIPGNQWGAMVVVCAYIMNKYNIPSSQIFGHQNYSATSCPGSWQQRLPQLRSAVNNVR